MPDLEHNNDVSLQAYIEAILDERTRSVDLAEREREKAAEALRIELARAIDEGDRNLRDHITTQITQLSAAAEAAYRLDLERHAACAVAHAELGRRIDESMERGLQRLEGLRRELELIQNSQREAISKAESATEKRFESVNEFREQLASQTGSFITREVADAKFAELHRSINDLTEKLGKVM